MPEVTPEEDAGGVRFGPARVFYAPAAGSVQTWTGEGWQPIGSTSGTMTITTHGRVDVSGVTTATGYRLVSRDDVVMWGSQTPVATYATYTYAGPDQYAPRYFLGAGETIDADSPDFRERERDYRERVWANRPTPQGFGEWQPDRAQVRQAEREWQDEQRDRQAAATRARELLYSWLSPDQITAYQDGEGIPVVGSSGTRFRIEPNGTVANIRIEDDRGFEVGRVCAHPDDETGIPTADAHLGQLLALTTDERRFLRTANWSGRRLRYGADGRLAVA